MKRVILLDDCAIRTRNTAMSMRKKGILLDSIMIYKSSESEYDTEISHFENTDLHDLFKRVDRSNCIKTLETLFDDKDVIFVFNLEILDDESEKSCRNKMILCYMRDKIKQCPDAKDRFFFYTLGDRMKCVVLDREFGYERRIVVNALWIDNSVDIAFYRNTLFMEATVESVS